MAGKVKVIFINVFLLLIVVASLFWHFMVTFCGMRGPHPFDICDIYRAFYFPVIAIFHVGAAIILVLQMSEPKPSMKLSFWIVTILILSFAVWSLLFYLFGL